MDLAQRYGMKVIYSVKDFYAGSGHSPGFIKTEADEKPNVLDRVKRFGDHPALLAWYLNDELPQSFMPRLEAHQQWISDADPNHPTWVVLYQFRQVGSYINTFDVIGGTRDKPEDVPSWLHHLVRHHDGKAYIFAVNDGDGTGQIRFHLSDDSPWRIGSVRDVTTNRTLALSQHRFVDDFEALSLHVYELTSGTVR